MPYDFHKSVFFTKENVQDIYNIQEKLYYLEVETLK